MREFRERGRNPNERGFRGNRGWRRDYEESHREVSMFVHNLPYTIDEFGVAGIFKKAGRVSDVYIPAKQKNRRNGRFGFVRFYTKEEARRSIELLHGRRIRGQRIGVFLAKPKRQTYYHSQSRPRIQQRQAKVRKEWRRKDKSGLENVEKSNKLQHQNQQGEKGQNVHAVISGQVNNEMESWLVRTLVGTTAEPRDLATLASAILTGYSPEIKVSALSCNQFLLVFPTEEKMLEALHDQGELGQWFIEIRKWGMEVCCETRRVWLDVIGVPPHGWLWENFKQIAELWGRMICLGKSSSNTESFEVMRVLVATRVMQKIEAIVLLHVGYGGYNVYIKEAETISQVPSKINQYLVSRIADDQISNNEVPGFEDVDDNISSPDSEGNRLELKKNQNNSNSNEAGAEDKEAISNNESRQHTLDKSRTKTASFSQNGYSEELLKLNKYLRREGNTKSHEKASETEQVPPGFEFMKRQENKEECTRKTLITEQQVEQQTAAGNSKAIQQNNSEDTSSSSTSGSLIRLAQESLHIGELLGVKVIGNVAAAISRITSPLKKGRKQGRKGKGGNKV